MQGAGCRVQGAGFRVQSLGLVTYRVGGGMSRLRSRNHGSTDRRHSVHTLRILREGLTALYITRCRRSRRVRWWVGFSWLGVYASTAACDCGHLEHKVQESGLRVENRGLRAEG